MSFYKKVVRQLYHTSVGQALWHAVEQVLTGHIGQKVVRKAYGNMLSGHNYDLPEGFWRIPAVKTIGKNSQSVLFVMPFFGQDAASHCFLSHCRAMKKLGYHVCALFYTSQQWDFRSDAWDEAYDLCAINPKYEKLVYDEHNNVIDDGHRLDDWCGDELMHFVAGLHALRQFDVCIVNYVFLSRILEIFTDTTFKVIFTHDIMSMRNSRMRQKGMTEKAFYYSTSKEDEICGLNRADLVIAIQDREAAYFSSVVDKDVRVDSLSYLPEDNSFKFAPSNSKRPVIGYFASGHGVNLTALQKFTENYHRRNPVLIGGSICDHIQDLNLDSRFFSCGRVDNLSDFYERCDIIINPDEFESGFKVKSIEALSFGMPLICTEAASIGLNSKNHYHHARDIHDLVILLEQALESPGELKRMKQDSIILFNDLMTKFDPLVFFEKHVKEFHENISNYSDL